MSDAPASVLARGRWDIVVPEETTNLIANPSIETGVSGYSGSGGISVQRTTNEAVFGTASMEASTASTATTMTVFTSAIPVSAGQPYTFSMWYRKTCPADVRGSVVVLFQNNLSQNVGTAQADLPAGLVREWTRLVLTAFAPASAVNAIIYPVWLSNVPTGRAFSMRMDGLQFEQKAYATTYVDGAQEGCVWLGAPHGSISYRSAGTRKGGRIMNLKSFKWTTAAVIGLGAAAVQPIAQPYAQIGGALYQRSVAPPRTFQIGGGWECDSDSDLHRQRAAMIDALLPAGKISDEPVRLIYTPLANTCDNDSINTPAERSVIIDAAYAGGLEGAWTNEVGQERATMVFTSYLPFMAVGASPFDSIATLTNINQANSAGNFQWRDMLTGDFGPTSGGTNGVVRASAIGPDGNIYVGGSFTSPGNNVAMWNGASWVAFGSGTNGAVNAIAFDASGALVIAGEFTTANGVSTGGLARWTGSTFATMGGVFNAQGFALVNDSANNIIVAGRVDAGGGLWLSAVGIWNGTTLTNISTQFQNATFPNNGALSNGGAFALARTADGVYVGGRFPIFGYNLAFVNFARIYQDNGSWFVARASNTDFSVGIDAIAALPNGTLVVGYATAPYISQVASGNISNVPGGALDGRVRGLFARADGSFMAAGDFASAGGLAVSGFVEWRGTWAHPDIQTSGGAPGYTYAEGGRWAVFGGSWVAATVANVTTIDVASNIAVNPEITTPGVGVWRNVRNWTTGDKIFAVPPAVAGALTIRTGERPAFDSAAGSLLPYVLPASNMTTFKLIPGRNRISIFATSIAQATFRWRNQYTSLDAVH